MKILLILNMSIVFWFFKKKGGEIDIHFQFFILQLLIVKKKYFPEQIFILYKFTLVYQFLSFQVEK